MDDFDIDTRAPVTATVGRVLLAPRTEVWGVLSDLQDWPRWNRALEGLWMDGPVAVGTGFEWRAEGWFIRSTLTLVDPPRRLGWTGLGPGFRIADVCELEPAGPAPADGTRVIRRQSIAGVLPRVFRRGMRRRLEVSLDEGLQALASEFEPRPSRRRAA
jgi:uncharacterized protein YndB with AHSA1/START domain